MGLHVAEDHFQVVPTNPNPNGRCLFAPSGQHENCKGPYIQFNALAAPIAEEVSSGKDLLAAVVCVSCLKEAIADADLLERSGQIEVPENGEPISMQEKIDAQPKPTFAFTDLPQDEQIRLMRDVGPGETVRYGRDVVLIPGERAKKIVQQERLDAPSPFSIVGVSGQALADPGEVPGKKRGTYEQAEDRNEDILAEFLEG